MQAKWIETDSEIKMNWKKYAKRIKIHKMKSASGKRMTYIVWTLDTKGRWARSEFTSKSKAKKFAFERVAKPTVKPESAHYGNHVPGLV